MKNNWLNKYQKGGYYEVQKGDSLWNISQNLGISFDKLIAANPQLEDPNVIHVGQTINLPTGNAPSVKRPSTPVKKETVPSRPSAPAMTFMSMPIGTIDRGMVSESTSVPIRTVQGAPVRTGYQSQTGTGYKSDPELDKRMRNQKAMRRMNELTAEHVDFVRDDKGNVVTDAQGNPVYNPAKGTTYGDNGMLPAAVLLAPEIIAATGAGLGTLETLMGTSLYSGAPAWATVGNALTAAAIPSIAENISEGDFTDALLLATPYVAEKAVIPAARKLAAALDQTFEGLKKSKDFISLVRKNPGKAAQYVYENHRPLYNAIFDGVYDLKKFKENPIGFLFGKKINPLTPELVELAKSMPTIPENVQDALNTSRALHNLVTDANFYKKEKNVEKQLQSLKSIHDKMPILSEEDFFRVTGESKESIVKRIKALEKQLGREPSTLTYQDDPTKIVDLTPYESELTFKAKSKNPLDDIEPIYPVGYNPPTKDYILESTYHGSRDAKTMGVQYGQRYQGEELSPTVIYDPAKPETSPRAVFVGAKNKFNALGSGKKYINATSLSTDSKQLELRSILNQLQEGTLKNVETEGLAYINDMGSTSKLPRKVLIDEMNQYIDKINVYLPKNKKVPHAVLQKNGDIWAPHFTITKKEDGGYITDEDMWLAKYKPGGDVMPADVLMDPKKMAQWMKDHPEATVQNANKQVTKDPHAVHVDPRLIKNAPKPRAQETVDYPASDPRSQSYTGNPSTSLLWNPNQVQGQGARALEAGMSVPIDLAAGTALGYAIVPPVVAAMDAPIVANAPAWLTANNMLTASMIPGGAKALSFLPADIQSGNLSGFGEHALEASLSLLPLGVDATRTVSPFVRNATLRAASRLGNEENALLPASMKFKSFAKNSNAVLDQLIGEIVRGRKNKQEIAEGNKWLQEWIDHPATQAKIDRLFNKPKMYINEGHAFDMNELSRNQLKSFRTAENVKEYPFMNQLEDIFKNKPHIHQENAGVSYQHTYDPYRRSQNQFNSRYGNWINRQLLPYDKKVGTTIHEGTHGWLDWLSLQNSGLYDMSLKNSTPDAVRLFKLWEMGAKDLSSRDAIAGYVANPTEMHARTMELRKYLGLSPDDVVTPSYALDVIRHLTKLENTNEAPITFLTEYLNTFGRDPEKMSNIFNNFLSVAPYAVPTAAAAASVPTILKNYQGLQQQKNGGWLNKYQSGTTNAQPYNNTNTVSIPPQANGQSFINYTNTGNNPVSLTRSNFSCPGGTCDLPTGEIPVGQTVQIPIYYPLKNPGSLYIFDSQGGMQNYKITPGEQIENFKNTVTASATTQVNPKPGIEETKKEEQTTSTPKPKYVFKCPEGAICGDIRGNVGGIGSNKGGPSRVIKEIYVNPETGNKRVKQTVLDIDGNILNIKEDLPLNVIYKDGGLLTKYK